MTRWLSTLLFYSLCSFSETTTNAWLTTTATTGGQRCYRLYFADAYSSLLRRRRQRRGRLLHNTALTAVSGATDQKSQESSQQKQQQHQEQQQTHRFHPTFQSQPVDVAVALSSLGPSQEAERALSSLSATILALLAGDEDAAQALTLGRKRQLIQSAFRAYDVCESGTLSRDEARQLFVDLARNVVTDLATPADEREGRCGGAGSSNGSVDREDNDNDCDDNSMAVHAHAFRPSSNKTAVPGAARAHAQRVLAMDEASTVNTVERIASKLLLMADPDMDGRVSLPELAGLFETIYNATNTDTNNSTQRQQQSDKSQLDTFPQPLMALAGSLQLVPATEGRDVVEAALSLEARWNVDVPGDDHTLRRVVLDSGKLSVVGLGRSADASSYFLPELGIVLDAGIHVKSLRPRTVLLTHGHRDHISALPVHAAAATTSSNSNTRIFCPEPIEPLVRRFLLAEAQLNFGDVTQTDDETIAALGDYDITGVRDGEEILLPRDAYQGSPTPIGVQVFQAPHKEGVPAVSYGLFCVKTRLKPQYASLTKSEIGKLMRQENIHVQLTETYHEGLLFYTGDTTINLLRDRWEEILPTYPHVIHEVTFLGRPCSKLDATSAVKGHTHYAQLHPWICAFPDTTFVLVHWSLRYSRDDVLKFFKEEYGGVPKNVVLWV